MRLLWTHLDFTNRFPTLKNIHNHPEISFSRPHLAFLQYYLHLLSWSIADEVYIGLSTRVGPESWSWLVAGGGFCFLVLQWEISYDF